MIHGQASAPDASGTRVDHRRGVRGAAETADDDAKEAASGAEGSPILRLATRIGLAMLGVVHVVIGGIAISAATHSGGGEADQSGAMSQIARSLGGDILLWLMFVALGALAFWQVAQFVLVHERTAVKRWGRRISEGGKCIAYAVLAISALVFALGGRQSSQHTLETTSRWLLSAPGGAIVVFIVGGTVVGVGIGFLVIGVRAGFRKLLRMPSGGWRVVVTVVGVIGYVAKGIALGVVGAFFVIAAVTGNARAAGGMDPALKLMRHVAFGNTALVLLGCGLIVYGLFCGIRAVRGKL
jgi:hypothetical protein